MSVPTNQPTRLNRRSTPPDVPGIYYFQDDEVIQRFGEKAFYICIIGEVRDPSRGLFIDYSRRSYQLPIKEHDLTAVFNHPAHRHEPVKNLSGIWWGPLPQPEDI